VLKSFQLGSDVVGVVDACSRARATVRVLAGGPRQGALSKRIGRAERVARLHNLSADVLIANVAAPVRYELRVVAAAGLDSWLLSGTDAIRGRRSELVASAWLVASPPKPEGAVLVTLPVRRHCRRQSTRLDSTVAF
jgi:hypothetical protein